MVIAFFTIIHYEKIRMQKNVEKCSRSGLY